MLIRNVQSYFVRTRLLLIFGWVMSPFGCRQLEGNSILRSSWLGFGFSVCLVFSSLRPFCLVLWCSGDVILDKFEFSPSIRVQASGSWHCVACFSAIWIFLVCVCLVDMAKSFFQGLKALVGKFTSLAAACGAIAGIITFFTSVCAAAAAWPLAAVATESPFSNKHQGDSVRRLPTSCDKNDRSNSG